MERSKGKIRADVALSGMAATTGEWAARRGARQVGVRARLGDAGVAELVNSFMAGTTREDLAAQSGISLSSVKRLLRLHGARRFQASATDGSEQTWTGIT
jgi:hypothetical protein